MPDDLILVIPCLPRQNPWTTERLIDTYLITDLWSYSEIEIRRVRPIPPELGTGRVTVNHLVL